MAYIDFPSSPVLNDEVTLAGTTYVWNGTGWTVKPAGGGAAPVDAYTKAESDTNFVNIPGDTMAGNLIITPTAGPAALVLNTPAAAMGVTQYQQAGVPKWNAGIGNTANYELTSYDAGGVGIPRMEINWTGEMILTSPNVAIVTPFPVLDLNKTTPTNQNFIRGMTNGAPRWTIQLGDNNPETGVEGVGSDFRIVGHNNDGTQKTSGFLISRVTGAMTVQMGLNVQSGSITQGGGGDWWAISTGIALTGDGAYKITTGQWAGTSDARTKTVLGPYEHGLAEILQINPVRYEFKGNSTMRSPFYVEGTEIESDHKSVLGKEFVGLVAQDVELPMPEMVSQVDGWIDNQPVTDLRVLDGTNLTYALINAVKELTARIETLEGALAAR